MTVLPILSDTQNTGLCLCLMVLVMYMNASQIPTVHIANLVLGK